MRSIIPFFIIFLAALTKLSAAAGIYGNNIPIKIWCNSQLAGNSASIGSVNVRVALNGNGEPPLSQTSPIPPGLGSGHTEWSSDLDFGTLKVKPFRTYIIEIDSINLLSGQLSVSVPDGYVGLLIGGLTGTYESYENSIILRNPNQTVSNNYRIELMVYPDGRKSQENRPVGECSSLVPGRIEWHVSLGQTYDGESAGEFIVMDTGETAPWGSSQLLPRLISRGTEMTMNGYGGQLTNSPSGNVLYFVPQALVEMSWLPNYAGYELAFYTREQGPENPGGWGYQLTGEPFVKYRIEKGTSDASLLITQETRNISSLTSTGNLVKRKTTSLVRTGTAPDFSWEVVDWKDLNAASSPNILHTSTVQTTGDKLVVSNASRYSGQSATAVSSEEYTDFPWGDALTKATVGSGTDLVTNYTYYEDDADQSLYGRLKSTKRTDGWWESYMYHYSATGDWRTNGGLLARTHRPWKNAPAAPSTETSSGESLAYEYASDARGRPTRPTSILKKINGVTVAKTAVSYSSAGQLYSAVLPLVQSERKEYSSDSEYLTTTTKFFSEGVVDPFFANKPHSVSYPDGTKTVYCYQYGTWSDPTFTPDINGGLGGLTPVKGSRLSIIKGTQASGQSLTEYAGYDIDEICLVDGKSTLNSTIYNNRAQKVREESFVWKSGGWHALGYKSFVYNLVGQCTSETDNSGETLNYTYDGLRLLTSRDNSGTETTYLYDVYGRLSERVIEAVGDQPELKTKFEYSPTGQMLTEREGWEQAEQLVSLKQYDTAGRLVSTTEPGLAAAVYSYNSANRQATVTYSGGATSIETKNIDGSLAALTGTKEVHRFISDSIDSSGRIITTERSGSSIGGRWIETTKDWSGRVVKKRTPSYNGGIVIEDFYYKPSGEASAGKLYKAKRSDSPAVRYDYDAMGGQFRSGVDFSDDGLSLGGIDRISEETREYRLIDGAWWEVEEQFTYPWANSSDKVTVSSTRTQLTNFPAGVISQTKTFDAEGNEETTQVTVDRTARSSTRTASRSGFTLDSMEVFSRGLLVEKYEHDASSFTYAYDGLERLVSKTDGRGVESSLTYHASSLLIATQIDGLNQVVKKLYYNGLGQITAEEDGAGFVTYFNYTLRGDLCRRWGSGTLPAEYTYDSSYADRTELKSFRGGTTLWESSTWPIGQVADTSNWTYEAATGLLTSVIDATGKTTTSTYNSKGQPTTVVQQSSTGVSVTKTITYFDHTGEIKAITYSDATPSINYYTGTPDAVSSYTRMGQVRFVSDAGGLRELVYSSEKPWRLSKEILGSGWGSLEISRNYETAGVVGRDRGFNLGNASHATSELTVQRTYSSRGLLGTVTSAALSAAGSFSFSYDPNASLLAEVSGNVGGIKNVRSYEASRNILSSVELKTDNVARVGFSFDSNAKGQRAAIKQYGTAFADYGQSIFQRITYSGSGSLESSFYHVGENPASYSTQTLMLGRTYAYELDKAGNRLKANNTASPELANLYSPGANNEYVTKENNSLTVSGLADVGASIIISGSAELASRQGKYWSEQLLVNNTNAPWSGQVSVWAANGNAVQGANRAAYLPKALQEFSYDFRGNLLSDGLWTYGWDAENRLISAETTEAARNQGRTHLMVTFMYDAKGRRIEKLVQAGAGTILARTRFIYEGWNLIAEYTGGTATSLGTRSRTYVWGADEHGRTSTLSLGGTLLLLSDHTSGKSFTPAYDGIGNIVAWFNYANSNLAALYEYSPFGEALRTEVFDSVLTQTSFGFGTKYFDSETDLIYFGMRYYSPALSRFVSRDPIGHAGGENLYDYCGGDPINRFDVLGLDPSKAEPINEKPIDIDKLTVESTKLKDWDSVWGPGIYTGRMSFLLSFTYNMSWPMPASHTSPYSYVPGLGLQAFSGGPNAFSPILNDSDRLKMHVDSQAKSKKLKAGQSIAVPIVRNGRFEGYIISKVAPNSAGIPLVAGTTMTMPATGLGQGTGTGAKVGGAAAVLSLVAAIIDRGMNSPHAYVVYQKFNYVSGKRYFGSTSGVGDAYSVMNVRDSRHHMNLFGYSSATMVGQITTKGESQYAYNAMRGLEQQMIDRFGGVGSPVIGNRINAVSPTTNLNAEFYYTASVDAFGKHAEFSGISVPWWSQEAQSQLPPDRPVLSKTFTLP